MFERDPVEAAVALTGQDHSAYAPWVQASAEPVEARKTRIRLFNARFGLVGLSGLYCVLGALVMWVFGASVLLAGPLATGWAMLTIAVGWRPLRQLRRPWTTGLAVVGIVHGFALVAAMVGALFWSSIVRYDFGEPTDRVVSDDGRFEVVTYEFSAMIDPGWTFALERVDGDGREWIWTNVESPPPVAVRFAAADRVEIVDDQGVVYSISFDPKTLEPSDRFCLRPKYCYRSPLRAYTSTGS